MRSMVAALFMLTAGLERARRQQRTAAALDLLQVIAGHDGMRPSDIADRQAVHPSLVTRQVRELEDAGYVQVVGDPQDGRSWLVALTPSGRAEMTRLQEIGLDRFALFVAEWTEDDVRTLAALLDKLRASITDVSERERNQVSRRERSRVLSHRPGPARSDDD